jgi:hypothetical protein
MKKLLLSLVLLLLLTGVGFAHAASPIQRDPVTVRIVSAPTFLGATPKCPALRSHVQLQSVAGTQLGTSLLCVQVATFDDATGIFTEIGTLTLYLPGGTIETAVTIVDDFAGFPIVTQSLTGDVVDGTGIYRGARGSITGGGTIFLGPQGPQPDLTFTVDFD